MLWLNAYMHQYQSNLTRWFFVWERNLLCKASQCAVQLNAELIKILQRLLKEQTGSEYDDNEAQIAGRAIGRFIQVKSLRNSILNNKKKKENESEIQ
jgi:hypothetical protein